MRLFILFWSFAGAATMNVRAEAGLKILVPVCSFQSALASKGTPACGEGHMFNRDTDKCDACPAGRSTEGPFGPILFCATCGHGKYSSEDGSATCTVCAAKGFGSYVSGSALAPTKEEELHDGEAFMCANGDLEAFCDSSAQTKCVLCPAGYQSNRLNSSAMEGRACKECDGGQYQDSPGKLQCKKCPPGQYVKAQRWGTHNATSCIKCPAGKHYFSFSIPCRECTEGRYTDSPGELECTECPPGKYMDEKNALSCIKCAAGKHSSENGSSCKQCGTRHTDDCPTAGTDRAVNSGPGDNHPSEVKAPV